MISMIGLMFVKFVFSLMYKQRSADNFFYQTTAVFSVIWRVSLFLKTVRVTIHMIKYSGTNIDEIVNLWTTAILVSASCTYRYVRDVANEWKNLWQQLCTVYGTELLIKHKIVYCDWHCRNWCQHFHCW